MGLIAAADDAGAVVEAGIGLDEAGAGAAWVVAGAGFEAVVEAGGAEEGVDDEQAARIKANNNSMARGTR